MRVQLYDRRITLTEKQLTAWQVLTDPDKKFIKLWGGSRSGKTFLCCLFIVLRAIRYARSDHIVCRYAKQTAKGSVWIQTLRPLLEICEKAGFCKINDTEQYAVFKNGSRISLGGLRPSDIGNILSAEYATFFICEANEIKWEIIDQCRARLNSLATDEAGSRIRVKFLIDLNPTFEHHWSNIVWIRGINPETRTAMAEFNKFANVHFIPQDNEANLSDGFIDTLDSLTGSRRRRFMAGEYGSYEGLVYSDFDETMIVDDYEIPAAWKKIRAVDFGFSAGHSFVCLWLAVDPRNERVIVYREYGAEKITVRIHAGRIKELSGNEKYATEAVCDHDAEDRATLEENGIRTKPANKQVQAGIDQCIDFIQRGKFHVTRSCVGLINDLYSYRWKETGSHIKDREVAKEDDNYADAFRYGLMELFPPKPRRDPVGYNLMD